MVGTKDSFDKNGYLQKKADFEKNISQSGIKPSSEIKSQANTKNEEKTKVLLSFDSQAELPLKGGIMEELSKCNFTFFQIRNI